MTGWALEALLLDGRWRASCFVRGTKQRAMGEGALSVHTEAARVTPSPKSSPIKGEDFKSGH